MSMRAFFLTVTVLVLLGAFGGPARAESGKCPPCDCPSAPGASKGYKNGSSFATLSVDSEPRGAEVYVDYEYQGMTPLQNARVPSGNVPVTLVKEGFQRLTTRVALKPGETKSLGVLSLGDAFGEITVKSYPARATVILDGEKINARTPVIIRRVPRDKPHTIRLEREGYSDWERVIILDDKEKKKYDVELEKRSK